MAVAPFLRVAAVLLSGAPIGIATLASELAGRAGGSAATLDCANNGGLCDSRVAEHGECFDLLRVDDEQNEASLQVMSDDAHIESKQVPTPAPTQPVCLSEADVVWVLDESGSMFGQKSGLTAFMGTNLGSFTYGPQATMAALVFFSSDATPIVDPLTDSLAALTSGVATWNSGGMTCMSCGLQKAKDILDASTRPSVPKQVVLLSDGNQTAGGTNQDAIDKAAELKNAGILVFTVALGSSVSTAALAAMASDPDADFAFTASTLGAFDAASFSAGICKTQSAQAPAQAPAPVASAKFDPHVENLMGERFDVNQPGEYLMLRLPRDRTRPALIDLRGVMRVDKASSCGLFIKLVTLTGEWLGDKIVQVSADVLYGGGSSQLAMSVSSASASGPGRWRLFADIEEEATAAEALTDRVTVAALIREQLGHSFGGRAFEFRFGADPSSPRSAALLVEQSPRRALNIELSRMGELGEPLVEIGGLLGMEKHDKHVEELTEMCKRARVRSARNFTEEGAELIESPHLKSSGSFLKASWK